VQNCQDFHSLSEHDVIDDVSQLSQACRAHILPDAAVQFRLQFNSLQYITELDKKTELLGQGKTLAGSHALDADPPRRLGE